MGEVREYVLLLDRGGPLAVNWNILLVGAEGGLLREAKVGL